MSEPEWYRYSCKYSIYKKQVPMRGEKVKKKEKKMGEPKWYRYSCKYSIFKKYLRGERK
jgi:hypothetical protein